MPPIANHFFVFPTVVPSGSASLWCWKPQCRWEQAVRSIFHTSTRPALRFTEQGVKGGCNSQLAIPTGNAAYTGSADMRMQVSRKTSQLKPGLQKWGLPTEGTRTARSLHGNWWNHNRNSRGCDFSWLQQDDSGGGEGRKGKAPPMTAWQAWDSNIMKSSIKTIKCNTKYRTEWWSAVVHIVFHIYK